jgi:hypothetical protein
MFSIPELWTGLVFPLLKLCLFISLGVFVGNLIEAMNWTRFMAMFATPLVRAGRLKDISGASFSMAFFSGITANTMLAEAYEQKKLNRKELVLSNLFNSLPTYFLHLPTTFFIIAPLIKAASIPYLMLTVTSAILRTIVVIFIGRFILPAKKDQCVQCELPPSEKLEWARVFSRVRSRFSKRFKKVMVFTVPIYSLFYILQKTGFFSLAEKFMSDHVGILKFSSPPGHKYHCSSIGGRILSRSGCCRLIAGQRSPRHKRGGPGFDHWQYSILAHEGHKTSAPLLRGHLHSIPGPEADHLQSEPQGCQPHGYGRGLLSMGLN